SSRGLMINALYYDQAQDGIRYRTVTGVQPCALPIWVTGFSGPPDCARCFQATWEQRAQSGHPKNPMTQEIPDFPYARYAELLGLEGIRVDSPDAVGPAWDRALSADRPVVLEACTDPEVPPLPPHITLEQAKAFAAALRKGDPNVRGMIRQTIRDKIEELVPSR